MGNGLAHPYAKPLKDRQTIRFELRKKNIFANNPLARKGAEKRKLIVMKLLLSLFALLFFFSTARSQDFSGYRTSSHTGVYGVFFNPANIAGSPFRWDATLVGLNVMVGNNKASFKLKDIGRSLNGDSLKNKVFAEGTGPSSGLVSATVVGPSFFFNLDQKSTLAVTTRARAVANVIDIDSKLARQIIDDVEDNAGLPYTVSSTGNMVVNTNGWTEIGLSYARELYNRGRHYLKGGLSVKYLAGAANASVNVGNLKGTIALDAVRNDAYLTASSGRMALSFGGINVSDFDADDLLSFNSTGLGFDLGFVYEFRPAVPGSDADQQGGANPYKFRFGAALLDAGSIKYTRDQSRSGGYTVNIPANQRFYLSALADAGIDRFKDTLNKYPQFFTPDAGTAAADYKAALPSTLQLDLDYCVQKGLYVNLATQLALTNAQTKASSSQYYNAVVLTPRYEGRSFGFYLPLSYNALTQFTAGASFRLGPVFFGSGSVLSALGGTKSADFFIGTRFGGFQKTKKATANENR